MTRPTRSRTPLPRRAGRLAALALAGASAACGAVDAAAPLGAAPACRAPHAEGGARVEWTVAAPDPHRPRLDRWCATVGRPEVDPIPDAPLPPPPAADSLAVIAWNVYGGGGDLRRLVGDLRSGQATGAPVAHFVILVQEAVRTGALPPAELGAPVPEGVRNEPPSEAPRDIVRAAGELGLALAYVPSLRNGHSPEGEPEEDRGNAILSTLPLREVHAIELPFEAQRRVAVGATVALPRAGGESVAVRVVSLHLDTRTAGWGVLGSLGGGRLRQARALTAALPPALPVVVGGDLNTWSARWLEGSVAYLRRHFPETPPPPPGPTFRTAWGFRRTLDHMFFRLPAGWSARYRVLPDTRGSDHYPLLGWVRLASSAAPARAPAP